MKKINEISVINPNENKDLGEEPFKTLRDSEQSKTDLKMPTLYIDQIKISDFTPIS